MKIAILSAIVFPAWLLSPASSQELIFLETFGTVAGDTAISVHEVNNGFDHDDFTYSGTGSIRNTLPSSATRYAGASAGANAFLSTTGGNQFLQIDGISTAGYEAGSLSLTFGGYKSRTDSDMSFLLFQYSIDGTTWTGLSHSGAPVGMGTSNWHLVTVLSPLPVASSLHLRWTNNDPNSTQFRIDDVRLVSIPEPAALSFAAIGLLPFFHRQRLRGGWIA